MPRTLTLATVVAAAAFPLTAPGAFAVGFLTQLNCASDYYAYCSQFQVGSKELRLCMRRAGPKLSKACLNALIADGEVSKAEVERTKQEIIAARNGAKRAADAKQGAKKQDAKKKDDEPKQKRTAVAKADAAPEVPEDHASHTSDKKPAHKNETPQKTEKLSLSQQTFAALKQRAPKFIEEAKAEESLDQQPIPDKRAPVAAERSVSAKPAKPKERDRASENKRKNSKASKAANRVAHKKSKAKTAAKKVKHQSASRKAQGTAQHAEN